MKTQKSADCAEFTSTVYVRTDCHHITKNAAHLGRHGRMKCRGRKEIELTGKQPSEAQELANAAYVWRKHVQVQMIDVLRDASVSLDTAEWWFERFSIAYRREIEAEQKAKA